MTLLTKKKASSVRYYEHYLEQPHGATSAESTTVLVDLLMLAANKLIIEPFVLASKLLRR